MVDPYSVAVVLKRLHRPGSIRRSPAPDDLPGDFEGWFDGGAFRSETGATHYVFTDGTRARVGVHPWLAVTITFADGSEVSVTESQRAASAAVCAGCGGALDPAITHEVIDGRAFHIGCAPRS